MQIDLGWGGGIFMQCSLNWDEEGRGEEEGCRGIKM